MTMPGQIVIAVLLILGGVFGLVGSWALVRLPDPMTRLHGPTKSATLGVGAVLMASMAAAYVRDGIVSWHELLVALFLIITAPLTGLFIAKAHLHLSWRADELPRPDPHPDARPQGAPGANWATFGDSAADSTISATTQPPRRPE